MEDNRCILDGTSKERPRTVVELGLRFCVSREGGEVASFPGLRPDFILQPWRKSGRRPGNEASGEVGGCNSMAIYMYLDLTG